MKRNNIIIFDEVAGFESNSRLSELTEILQKQFQEQLHSQYNRIKRLKTKKSGVVEGAKKE